MAARIFFHTAAVVRQTYKTTFSANHKFLCRAAHGDEIHALRQIGHINLLGFSSHLARHQGLAHEVGDAVGFR